MKRIVNVLGVIALLVSTLALPPVTALAQDEIVCEHDHIVQAGDWLSKLADYYYGDMFAYPAIVYATNVKAATDSSYATIINPYLIEPGWKLCIPSKAETQVVVSAPENELAKVIGPVLMYYLERYFSNVPFRRTEVDRYYACSS